MAILNIKPNPTPTVRVNPDPVVEVGTRKTEVPIEGQPVPVVARPSRKSVADTGGEVSESLEAAQNQQPATRAVPNVATWGALPKLKAPQKVSASPQSVSRISGYGRIIPDEMKTTPAVPGESPSDIRPVNVGNAAQLGMMSSRTAARPASGNAEAIPQTASRIAAHVSENRPFPESAGAAASTEAVRAEPATADTTSTIHGVTGDDDRPASIFGRVSRAIKDRSFKLKQPSHKRSASAQKAVKKRAAQAFKRSNLGYRIYDKINGLPTLDLRDVGVGIQEILAIVNQNPTMLNKLIESSTGVKDDVSSWSPSELVEFVNSHDIYVATFKEPTNQREDMQRRRLKVLVSQQRGIYLHPLMESMYNADNDGDDMEVSLDPSVAKKASDPMDSMVGISGQTSLKPDFLPVTGIEEGFRNGEGTKHEYARTVILGAFSNYSNEQGIGELCDAIVKLSESALKGDDAQIDAWNDVFRAARAMSDAVIVTGPKTRSLRNKLMSDLCRAIFDGMQKLKIEEAITTIDGDIIGAGNLPDPRTYDDAAIYAIVREFIAGELPRNFQDLKVLMNGFIGNVEGKNAPFRFSADVGKLMKLDTRLQIGDGSYLVDQTVDEQVKLFFQSTVKYAESMKQAKEIKMAGRSQYYTELLRFRVLRDVGFPERYGSFAEFLQAFAFSYNKHSSVINQASLKYLTNMKISSDKKSLVDPIKMGYDGTTTIGDLASPILAVYGSYSIGRMFKALANPNGPMGKAKVDPRWAGNPKAPRSNNHPLEREFDQYGSRGFWITGKYADYNLHQFAYDNTLLTTGSDDIVKRARSRSTGNLDQSDIVSQFELLVAIADKGTSRMSSFCTKVYGKMDSQQGGYNGSDRAAFAPKTTVEMMSELTLELDRLDKQGTVITPGFYAGIGSRETPNDVKAAMTRVAQRLASSGWVMRSGHARGADQAFEAGAGKNAEVYLVDPKDAFSGYQGNGRYRTYDDMSADAQEAAERALDKYHPAAARLRDGRHDFAYKAQRRNYFQVCGVDGAPDSAFIACWTPVVEEQDRRSEDKKRPSHGTDQAIRIARSLGIPVFNAAEYDDLSKWEADVIKAAAEADAGRLTRYNSRDQMLWVNDTIAALIESGPDMFSYFNMDSPAGFLESKWARKMVEHAGNPEILGGIRTAMVFEYRMAHVNDMMNKLPDPNSNPDAYRDAYSNLEFALDELAASSKVWRGIIKELKAESTPGMSSVFQSKLSGGQMLKKTADGSGTYRWNVELDGKAFWSNPGDHTTLLSVINDLDMDRTTKWSVIADVVRYWENDAFLKSYEVGLQLEIGSDPSYSLRSQNMQSMLGVHREFEQAFSRWGKRSQENLQSNIDKAAYNWKGKKGKLTTALERLDRSPWELIAIDDLMYADSLLSVLDKTYAQTEKASQHPWTNAIYSALSAQRNGGFMNDITRTDDRMLGIQSADTIGLQEIIHILADPEASITVYDSEGRRGILTRKNLIESALGREVSGNGTEADIWAFLQQEPRVATAIRKHNACVMADTDGTGWVGATLSTDETIQMMTTSPSRAMDHIKYIMRDHPIYAGIISLATKAYGAVTRNQRTRVVYTEQYLCNQIAQYASNTDVDSTEAAVAILSSMGITSDGLRDIMRSDYDKFCEAQGLPVIHDSEIEDGDGLYKSDDDADFTYYVAMSNLARYIEEVRREVPLDGYRSLPSKPASGKGGAIRGFRGDNHFLSNFYECTVSFEGIVYRNAEAAFQAQKCADPADRQRFANLTGSKARALGRKVQLRDDWESIKEDVMRNVVKAKFSNPELRQKLEATGTAELIESNNWNDTFWGVSGGVGENRLGMILMDERLMSTSANGLGRPSFIGMDISSVSSFWDVLQELGGAKTNVSTGIEGSETYHFAEWASHISAKDRYADYEAVDDIDKKWNDAWTNLSDEDGNPIVLQVDESGAVINNDQIMEAKERLGIDEIVVKAPEGYTVKDRSTDSSGNPVASLFIYMVSKRSNGAEAFNLKAKKAGLDGKDSITKMQGKRKQLYDEQGNAYDADFDEIERNLRKTAHGSGIMAAKIELANMMLQENRELGYNDLTLSNYLNIADMMLIEGQDGEVYLRTLEMLFTAIKHRIGASVDDMDDNELRAAADAIVADNSENGVGIAMMNPIDALDNIKICSKASSTSGIRPTSSVFERNYNLLEAISNDVAQLGIAPMDPNVQSKLNAQFRADGGVDGFIGDLDVVREYSIVGCVGIRGMKDLVNYTVGPSNAIIIGPDNVSDEKIAEICDMAYRCGMTVIVSSFHRDAIPQSMVKDSMPCSDTGDVLIPCFDMRLNGAESLPYNGGRFAVFQAPFSRYVVSVEDSLNWYMLGDAQYKPTKALTDRIKVVWNGSRKILAENLFPNVFRNPAFANSTFEVSLASGEEIDRLINNGERCTIDYGIVEGAPGFERRVRDVDAAIERYRSRYAEADADGIIRGGMAECHPGDIVAWAEVAITSRYTGRTQYVLAPIIPFNLHSATKNVPETFTVEQIGYTGDDNTQFSIDWTNTSEITESYAKYFDSSGGANKGMIDFTDAIQENLMLRDGTSVDAYCAKASTDSRKIGTDRRIKTMISLMALARMHGYNFARSDGAFPENPEIRDALLQAPLPTSRWRELLHDGSNFMFSTDPQLNAFLTYECRKVIKNGGNPSDYLANLYTGEDGIERNTHVMWEFEAMFDQGLAYEDSLLRFLHHMDNGFCPNGIEDDTEYEYGFRLAKEDGALARGYNAGVLQMQTPRQLQDGRIAYIWDNVYIGMSFFGEDYSGFSRPNIDGASNFLDAMNTMSYYGVQLDEKAARFRAMWATSDLGRIPRDGGAIGIM